MKKNFIIISLTIIISSLTTQCKKDKTNEDSSSSIIVYGPNVIDVDGNLYHSIIIGNQTWMLENLKTTKFRDGTPIPNVTNDSLWNSLTTAAYCDNSNDTNNSNIYGRLYNGYAVTDTHHIAPQGWHIPSKSEWNILEKFLDNSVDTNTTGYVGTHIGILLKESGNTHWQGTNSATNKSGFAALPAGLLTPAGMYSPGGRCYWWSTVFDTLTSSARGLIYNSDQIIIQNLFTTDGLSVRCVKD